jgi:hypothetical protein
VLGGRTLLLFTLLASVVACGSDRWLATVYPNKSNLLNHRNLGEFPTLEECRAAAQQYLRDTGASERGDYECGRNCRRETEPVEIYFCEETLR